MPNLFAGIPSNLPNELLDTLVASGHVRIERIVSAGQVSPDGFWYDQPQHEFVLLLAGSARLRFEGDDQPLELGPGDYVTIAAHQRHRVEWTSADETSIWLAVHYGE